MSKRKEMEQPEAIGGSDLFVYSCKWSGDHAFTIDCKLDDLPMRRTDNARIVDTKGHVLSLHLEPGGTKLLRRRNGTIERQYRYHLGRLPVAYKSQPDGRFLFVFDDAVECVDSGSGGAASAAAPVPPCVLALPGGAGLVIDAEDKGERPGIVKVRPDVVRVQLTTSLANDKCNVELLDFLSRALATRRSALSVTSGRYKRRKVVQVLDVSREALHKQLQNAISKGFAAAAVYQPSGEPRNV